LHLELDKCNTVTKTSFLALFFGLYNRASRYYKREIASGILLMKKHLRLWNELSSQAYNDRFSFFQKRLSESLGFALLLDSDTEKGLIPNLAATITVLLFRVTISD